MSDTYTCESCKQTFPRVTPAEECLAEMMENFPGTGPQTDVIILCDPCYKNFMRELKG